jgi:hypothetical protein
MAMTGVVFVVVLSLKSLDCNRFCGSNHLLGDIYSMHRDGDWIKNVLFLVR